MTGQLPKELEASPCPHELSYIWSWFLELSGARSSNGFAANPIQYSEIDAWARLKKINITPFEVEAIVKIDGVFLSHMAEKAKKDKKRD